MPQMTKERTELFQEEEYMVILSNSFTFQQKYGNKLNILVGNKKQSPKMVPYQLFKC